MIYIGIDLGRQGGIAVVDKISGKLLQAFKMPLTKEGETDARKLLNIITKCTSHYSPEEGAHLVFERVNSFFGIGQAQIVGVCRESGIVEAVAQISKMPYTKVTPQKWQNYMFANEKAVYKLVKKRKAFKEGQEEKPTKRKKKAEMVQKLDTKAMSGNKFVKSFPNYQKFEVITKRTGTLCDGICDAGMLGLYGKMLNF